MFKIKNENKYIKICLIAIIVVFFIVNLYASLKYGPTNYLGSFEKLDNDDVKYIRSAWELANNGHFIYHKVDEPTVFIMPGLTCTIAFFVKIFGKFGGLTAFRIFQALLQALSMYLLFLIGRRVFNSKAALFGCILNSLYIAEYYTNTVILTETLFKFLFLLLIYISLYAIEEKKILHYTIGGIIWGLGCLVRPTIALYPGVILIMWIIKKYSLKDMIKFTIITTLAFSVVMSSWWIRNYLVFDRFIPLTLSSGNPFLQGTYVNYDQSIDYTPYEVGKTVVETNENEIKAGLYRLKTYAVKEPLKYAQWYTIGKSWHLWNYPFYWKEIFGVSFVSAGIFHYLVLLLAIVESIRMFIKRNRRFLFIFATVILFNLMYLPFFIMSRYSYPIMPLVCIVAGHGIFGFIRRRLELGQAADSNS